MLPNELVVTNVVKLAVYAVFKAISESFGLSFARVVQSEFGIKFAVEQCTELQNLQQLIEFIDSKSSLPPVDSAARIVITLSTAFQWWSYPYLRRERRRFSRMYGLQNSAWGNCRKF